MTATRNQTLALEARARRAARRIGLVARKSRRPMGPAGLVGGFSLIDSRQNWIVFGEFDLSAQDVIEWCSNRSD